MPRKGQHLEDWAEEVINGTPTNNSGATNEDADMKVGGVGGRLYEFKSSETTGGLSINRVAVLTLLQRAVKLNRDPVFIYRNKHGVNLAVVPYVVFDKRMRQFTDHNYAPEAVKFLQQAFQTLPIINAKGNNIRIKEEELTKVMEINGVMAFKNKTRIPWIILPAEIWLEFIGDNKPSLEDEDV